ncbi:phosphotransferase family protein [Streptomyces sp. PKU-EA00015]|uniref:phosphotransferase family protein n=1 Tax=Streptomyces sp. PKU-EA00015 TaxID=2748326 RepID=UPI00210C466E|nr:aminoglycoside phosphotransferase family protein [Streptomyces sp. PKU-EA00015]
MTVGAETDSEARRRAVMWSDGGDRVIVGPLKGYHHETYAFPLPPESPLRPRYAWGKLRSPRSGVLWYDRRCFASEDRLLLMLKGRVDRVPESVEVTPGVYLQGFVEGRPPGGGPLPGRPLSGHHEGQLARLFQQVVAIKTDEFDDLPRTCLPDGHPVLDDDSTVFLNRLTDFTATQVYDRHAEEYGELFERLGVRRRALEALALPAGRLANRPFALVHGDLHRHNFIVDHAGDLWTIDWELAMIGDPLYELATHLHLMRYSTRDAQRVGTMWAGAVEEVRPGASREWQRDLPYLLAYKRVQSVFTDVVRAAVGLGPRNDPHRVVLPVAAWKVRRVLEAAKGPLGLTQVPTVPQVMSAYAGWLKRSGGATAP